MKKLQKGAWLQKLVLPAKAARACFRRFFAAHTPSPKPAHQASPKYANQTWNVKSPKNAHQASPKHAYQARNVQSPKAAHLPSQLAKAKWLKPLRSLRKQLLKI